MAISESTEMYLKTILELSDNGEPVAISQIADRLGVSAVSATEMVKRLEEREMVVHTPYKGVVLTSLGRLRGLAVLRRHRLWESFLVERLNLPWEQSHEIACRLEHAADETLTQALAAYLENPAHCPHGNAIPTPDGELVEPETTPLNELGIGQSGVIARIFREETPLLNYLAERDLYPGGIVQVEDIAPYNGPLTIRINGKEVILGLEIAARILINVKK